VARQVEIPSDWLDEPLGSFVERIADETPAPGAGSTAAIVLSMAAALVEMAARFSHDWDGAGPAAARARALREQALPLAARDAEGYDVVLKAARRPERDAELRAALTGASVVPLELAHAGAEVAELGAMVAASGKRSLRGDAAAGAVLAAAAASAAANLVAINLAENPADDGAARAAEFAAAATAAADRALEASA
jgi:formiminotetrahydrofolate cyclodeaminase